MIIRAKTKRRLFILVAGFLLLCVGLTTLYVLRMRQVHRELLDRRARGMAAHQRGDYPAALNALFKYVARYPDDSEAVLSLAESRYHVESPDGSHLPQAVHYLRRASDLQPDNLQPLRLLLDSYLKLGYHSEAIDTAKKLLAMAPDEIAARRALSIALAHKKEYAEALKHAEAYTKQVPDDFELQRHVLGLYYHCGKTAEIIPRAVKLLEEHPDDGRFELLLAIACNGVSDWTAADREQAHRIILKLDPQAQVEYFDRSKTAEFFIQRASRRVPPDSYFVQILISELDRIGLGNEAISLLQRAELGRNDPGLQRILVRRLWEAHRFADVDRAVAFLDPNVAKIDPEIIALRAISLVSLNRKEEAGRLSDALAQRTNDRAAVAWSAVVRHLFLSPQAGSGSGAGSLAACAQTIHDALTVRGYDSTYLRFFLAETYSRMGEYASAVELLRHVREMAPHWVLPLQRLSQLLLMTGQSEFALVAADAALQQTQAVSSAATLFVTAAAAANQNLEDSGRMTALLDLASQVQRAAPGEPRTLPLYVLLLARSGQREAAESAVRSVLKATDQPDEALLLRLAAASRQAALGLEEQCFSRAETAYGTTADLAFARAVDLLQQGRGGDALTSFDEMRTRSTVGSRDRAWRLARARLLEAIGDAGAATAWTELGRDAELAADLVVQRNILAARSAHADRQLIEATIERLRVLTGDNATGWRLARARWLLQGQPAPAALDEAVDLLKRTTEMLPTNAETRQLLSVALEKNGDLRGAAEHLAAAGQLKPSSNAISLELARLYQAQAEFDRAQTLIERVARDADKLTLDERRQLVALLARRGESARAIELMQANLASTEAADQLITIEMLRRRNELDEADRRMNALLAQPTLHVIEAAAAYFASTGRPEEADRALTLIGTLPAPSRERALILARHRARVGQHEVALRHYQNAVAADPASVEAAQGVIVASLRLGRVADALSAADRLGAQRAGDRSLALLRERAALLKAAADDRQLVPLIVSVVESPDSAEVAIAAIQLLVDARRAALPATSIINKLRPLADRAPRLIPLQRLLLDRYIAVRQMQDAIAVARRCMSFVPDSPELARMAAEVFAAAQDWNQAIAMARRWRELAISQPLDADLFLADMHLRLGNADAALQQLHPYAERSAAAPDSLPAALVLRSKAMLIKGDLDGAGDLLWPLALRSKSWRIAWVQLTDALTTPGAVEAWLGRIAPAMPESAADEQIALANGWFGAGERLQKNQTLTSHARTILDRLLARPDAGTDAFFGRAVMYEVEGDLANAESAYRRTLELQPGHFVAANNLAMVIAHRGGDLAEAMELASRAVRAQPRIPSLLDTLAFVQQKSGEFRSAIANLRSAVNLEPHNITWRLNLIDALIVGGQRNDALGAMRELEAMLPNRTDVSTERLQRLESFRLKLRDPSPGQSAAVAQ